MRLPFRTRIPQREHVLAAPFLAAEKPTSRRKNRVGGFARRTAYRAPRNTAQVAKPRRVAAGCSYKPASGRAYFLNQDPISEQGGLNLYAFCGNNGVNRWDHLGMYQTTLPRNFLKDYAALSDTNAGSSGDDNGNSKPPDYYAPGSMGNHPALRGFYSTKLFGVLRSDDPASPTYGTSVTVGETEYLDDNVAPEDPNFQPTAPNNTADAGGNRYDSATDSWIRPDGTSYRVFVDIPDFEVLATDVNTSGLQNFAPYQEWDGTMTYQTPFPSTYQSPHVPNSNDLFNSLDFSGLDGAPMAMVRGGLWITAVTSGLYAAPAVGTAAVNFFRPIAATVRLAAGSPLGQRVIINSVDFIDGAWGAQGSLPAASWGGISSAGVGAYDWVTER